MRSPTHFAALLGFSHAIEFVQNSAEEKHTKTNKPKQPVTNTLLMRKNRAEWPDRVELKERL